MKKQDISVEPKVLERTRSQKITTNANVILQVHKVRETDFFDEAIGPSPNKTSRSHLLDSKVQAFRVTFTTVLLTSIAIIVGILIVCLTSPKQPNPSCSLTFKPLITNTNNLDSLPSSIALGYVNNDSILDIVVANSNTNTIGIFIGYISGIFADQITYPTGYNSRPRSVDVGDLNNDNQTDIVVANYGTHDVGIFLGIGNGTFTNKPRLATYSSRPVQVVLGHLNNDSLMDIIVTNFGTNDISIFLGFGNGYFVLEMTYSTGYDSLPSYVTITDFNYDARLDILIANSGTDNFGILFGNGNGTFANQKIYSTGSGSRPSSIAVGDFNNDNRLDVAIAKSGTKQIGIFVDYSNGSFSKEITLSTGIFTPFHITVHDFNNDTYQDIAVINQLDNSLSIFIGFGNSTFSGAKTYSTGLESRPISIAVEDFNNDHRLDIAVVNIDSNNVDIFIGDNPASFQTSHPYPTGDDSQPIFVAVGDFNHDSQMDIVVANSFNGSIGIFLGNGDGNFRNQVKYLTGAHSRPYYICGGDFNNDSRLDIAVANNLDANIGIFLGYDNGTFGDQKTYMNNFGRDLRCLAIGDFNNDNQLDIVVASFQDGTNIGVFIGYGNGAFSDQPIYSTECGPSSESVAVGDFNHDKHLDIVSTSAYGETLCILFGDGNGSFQRQNDYHSNSGKSPSFVIVNDMNSDSHMDIVVLYSESSHIGILLGHGDGTFSNEIIYLINNQWKLLKFAVGDLNDDNRMDLALLGSDSNDILILLGFDNGTFAPQVVYSPGSGSTPVYVTVGNFNNDNRMDLVTANLYTNSISICLGFDNATFLNQITYSTGSASHPVSIITKDFNRDNRLDIAIANYGSNTVGIRFGYSNGTFSNEMTYSTGFRSLPNAIVATDFNNDNILDIAIANFGTNNIGLLFGFGNGTFASKTPFSTGNRSRPPSIAVGNFNNDTWLDIAVTNSGIDTVGIFLGFNYISFPIQTTYQTGSDSAPYSAAVGDFNMDKYLDLVVINQMANNISILLGYGNGYFALHATYSTGLDTNPFSAAVGDFNHDNRLDFVVSCPSNNSLIVFLGDKNANFPNQTIYPTDDGSTPGTVAISDFNNDHILDIVVTNFGRSTIGIFLGYGNGTFGRQMIQSTGSSTEPISVAVGDFNHDNRMDITVANSKNNILSVFLGYRNGTFQDAKTYSTGSTSVPRSVAVGDFNRDNQLDIVVANSNAEYIGIFIGHGNGTFADQITLTGEEGFYPNFVAVDDFNKDNISDIVVTDLRTGNIYLYLGSGDQTFRSQIIGQLGRLALPNWIVIGDFNNDKILDIIIVNPHINTVNVLLADCCYPFQNQISFSTGSGSHPHAVVVLDFNNDHHLDVMVANEGNSNIGILFGSGDGNFSNQTTFSTGSKSRPYSIATGDFNNDKRLDIVVANYGTESVAVFLGYNNGTFVYDHTYRLDYGSLPNFVTVNDFNNDTQLDIAASNDGTHNIVILYGYGNGSFGRVRAFTTGYNSQPSSLAVGDFTDDTYMDIIVAMAGTNNIGIISKLC